MFRRHRRARAAFVLIALLVGGIAVAPSSHAQDNPIMDLFTTTSTTPPTTKPKPTSTTATTAPAGQAPGGAEDAKGDGATPPAGGIVVPPEAQKLINAVKRTRPSNDEALVAGLAGLTALGMSQEEAYRIGMGRFPVAGVVHYSHDWLYPRYGPGFRFHLGCDVFAAYGTPLRAPVDGVLQSHQDPLGGLSVRVVMPDKTYFYLAHLSAVVEGFQEGMPVKTGDIVGYVGDSGNAKGGTPHVHVGVYPKGGPATDPKPILDGFLQDAAAQLPGIIAGYAASHPLSSVISVPLLPTNPNARLLRPTLSARAMQGFTSGGDAWTPTALYVLASDPSTGAGVLLQSTLDDLAGLIDWSQR
jgi:murein DD-endopeptidase MepM/ murein hydrolase activator NlpD